MKLYKRVPRHVKVFVKRRAEKYRWALSLEEGDIFAACTGFNHVLKDMKIHPRPYRSGWYIQDITLIDTKGEYHSLNNCVSKPETVQQIENSYRAWDNPKSIEHLTTKGWITNRMIAILSKLRAGERICDDRGVILPELNI